VELQGWRGAWWGLVGGVARARGLAVEGFGDAVGEAMG